MPSDKRTNVEKKGNFKQVKHPKKWRWISIVVLATFLLGSLLTSILSVYLGSQIKTPPTPPTPSPVKHSASNLKKWRKIAKESPDDPLVLQKYSEALMAVGKNKKARKMLQRAQMLAPSDYRIQELLGKVDLLEHKIANAVHHFQKALKLNPGGKNLKTDLEQAKALLKKTK